MAGNAKPDRPGLPAEDILAQLCAGRFDDPFGALGPRKVGRATYLTVFDPGAAELAARQGSRRHRLDQVEGHPGIFHGKITGAKPYRLTGKTGDGVPFEYEDAFRFGPVLSDVDEYLLGEGTHRRLWHALGAHVMQHEGCLGVHFAVWAPNARRVSVFGDFNHWDARRHVMRRRGASGVWEIFIPGVGDGAPYKYEIIGPNGDVLPPKADPVGFGSEHPPAKASVVRDIKGYGWKDTDWMATRQGRNARAAPISVYEVHLGSWRRKDGGRPISYREAAEELVGYASDMGFTHIELMPVSEYPFDGSWGYQPIGLYAPTIRYGPPHEFCDLVDAAHRAGIGVILDWVPGHFPTDEHGLRRFDGTPLYEHSDPREGFHQDWNTLIYNYGRREVANYLISNALYWLEEYHIDGLRVDAVASMLYRDYSRKEGEWVPNVHGGRENLEAIDLVRRMNTEVYREMPGIMTVAEESTSFPQVTGRADAGGLGFGYKWNMGWMNDTLRYIEKDPVYRRHDHHLMTFGIDYAFSENFILPISHDEVVHGKGSMLSKMPGPAWEKFANLRAYYGFMWGHPGKKLLFMGCEFAQPDEWNHDTQIDWDAAARPEHAGVQRLIRDLNTLYRGTPALHVKDSEHDGFQWIEGGAADLSVFAFARFGKENNQPAVVICNFTPVERTGWRCGLPRGGTWREAINTDAGIYGGANRGNLGGVHAESIDWHGQAQSAELTLPPLSCIILTHASD